MLLPMVTAVVVPRRSFVIASFAARPCAARNLPVDEGATGKARGEASSLVPIVATRTKVRAAIASLPDVANVAACLAGIPTKERDFKRLFDEFSEAVSYKQRFLDSNAFLVYYTRGFDGPGRPNIEEGNELETRQYGARNDAWVAFDDVLAELDYLRDGGDAADLKIMLTTMEAALDAYLALAPPDILKQAT